MQVLCGAYGILTTGDCEFLVKYWIGLVSYKKQHHVAARLDRIASEGGLISREFCYIQLAFLRIYAYL